MGQCRIEAHTKIAPLLEQAPPALLATTDKRMLRQRRSTPEKPQGVAAGGGEQNGSRSLSLPQPAAAQADPAAIAPTAPPLRSAASLLSPERIGAETRPQRAAALQAWRMAQKTATKDVPAGLARLTMMIRAELGHSIGRGGVGGDIAYRFGGKEAVRRAAAGMSTANGAALIKVSTRLDIFQNRM